MGQLAIPLKGHVDVWFLWPLMLARVSASLSGGIGLEGLVLPLRKLINLPTTGSAMAGARS